MIYTLEELQQQYIELCYMIKAPKRLGFFMVHAISHPKVKKQYDYSKRQDLHVMYVGTELHVCLPADSMGESYDLYNWNAVNFYEGNFVSSHAAIKNYLKNVAEYLNSL